MNNREREMWINNDEGLYRWWKSSGMGITPFIKENREEIDKYILSILERKPNRPITF